MGILSNAPLIEAIFELRWGGVGGSFDFNQEKMNLDSFSKVARDAGYVIDETLNDSVPDNVPRIPRKRLRKEIQKWPCLQVGMGIFTINVTNEFYRDWKEFQAEILFGLGLFHKAHAVEDIRATQTLRYIDGFQLKKAETVESFLKDKMALSVSLPQNFLLDVRNKEAPLNSRIVIEQKIDKPSGLFVFDLMSGQINGDPSVIMHSVVQSTEQNLVNLKDWLTDAHAVQKKSWEEIIKPKFSEELK